MLSRTLGRNSWWTGQRALPGLSLQALWPGNCSELTRVGQGDRVRGETVLGRRELWGKKIKLLLEVMQYKTGLNGRREKGPLQAWAVGGACPLRGELLPHLASACKALVTQRSL